MPPLAVVFPLYRTCVSHEGLVGRPCLPCGGPGHSPLPPVPSQWAGLWAGLRAQGQHQILCQCQQTHCCHWSGWVESNKTQNTKIFQTKDVQSLCPCLRLFSFSEVKNGYLRHGEVSFVWRSALYSWSRAVASKFLVVRPHVCIYMVFPMQWYSWYLIQDQLPNLKHILYWW